MSEERDIRDQIAKLKDERSQLVQNLNAARLQDREISDRLIQIRDELSDLDKKLIAHQCRFMNDPSWR